MPVYDPNVSLDPDDPAPVAVADPQHPGLPKIDPSLNTPLPQGNADLVPYRIARTDPGMAQVTTTGYAPRARAPIQPPGGGGIGAPDLGPLYAEAFKRLPVDKALQAVEAANKFVAQRGYMRDIESGKNAAEAFAKWGPMLFKNATGIPEAIDRSVPTPISPYQQAQLAIHRQTADAARQKAAGGDVRVVGGGLYRIKPGAAPETLVAPAVKPDPPGSLTVNEKGEVTAAHGAPGSAAIKGLVEKAAEEKAKAALPRPPGWGRSKKITAEAIEKFKEFSGGDKDKAKKVAKELGWEF